MEQKYNEYVPKPPAEGYRLVGGIDEPWLSSISKWSDGSFTATGYYTFKKGKPKKESNFPWSRLITWASMVLLVVVPVSVMSYAAGREGEAGSVFLGLPFFLVILWGFLWAHDRDRVVK